MGEHNGMDNIKVNKTLTKDLSSKYQINNHSSSMVSGTVKYSSLGFVRLSTIVQLRKKPGCVDSGTTFDG